MIGGSAIWAMLPIITKTDLKATATGYGVLLGCMGVGSMAAALLLAKFRLRFSPDQLIVSAGAVWGIVTALLGWLDSFTIAAIAMFAAGVAWVTEMSSFNVAAQTVLAGLGPRSRISRLSAGFPGRHGARQHAVGRCGGALWQSGEPLCGGCHLPAEPAACEAVSHPAWAGSVTSPDPDTGLNRYSKRRPIPNADPCW